MCVCSGPTSAKARPSSARSSSFLRSSSSSVASGGARGGAQTRGVAGHTNVSSSARDDCLRHSREKVEREREKIEGGGGAKGARRALSGKLAAASSASNTSLSAGGGGGGGGGVGGRSQQWAHEREQESGAGEGAAYHEVYVDDSEPKFAQPAFDMRDGGGGGGGGRHMPPHDSLARSPPHVKNQHAKHGDDSAHYSSAHHSLSDQGGGRGGSDVVEDSPGGRYGGGKGVQDRGGGEGRVQISHHAGGAGTAPAYRREGPGGGGFVPLAMQGVDVLQDTQVIRSVAWCPAGRSNLMAYGTTSRALRFAEASEARGVRIVYEVADYHGGSIYGLAWHSKGYLLATGSNDKTIQLTRVAQGEAGLVSHTAPRVLHGHTGTVRCVAWCERMGAAHLVSGGAGDCMVRQWDGETGECVVALAGHHDHVQDLWYFYSLLLLLLLLQFFEIRTWHVAARQTTRLSWRPAAKMARSQP